MRGNASVNVPLDVDETTKVLNGGFEKCVRSFF